MSYSQVDNSAVTTIDTIGEQSDVQRSRWETEHVVQISQEVKQYACPDEGTSYSSSDSNDRPLTEADFPSRKKPSSTLPIGRQGSPTKSHGTDPQHGANKVKS